MVGHIVINQRLLIHYHVYHTLVRRAPGAAGIHINFKEALAVETAAVMWAHKWSNHRVFVYCDNQAAVGILNKGKGLN